MFPSLEWWPDVENNKLENDILENNDQENVDLENDDLENNDLESDDVESVDLEDDDLESEDLECSVFFIFCIYSRLLNSDTFQGLWQNLDQTGLVQFLNAILNLLSLSEILLVDSIRPDPGFVQRWLHLSDESNVNGYISICAEIYVLISLENLRGKHFTTVIK